MQIKMRIGAEDSEVRFAFAAEDLGATIPVNLGDRHLDGRVVAATLVDDGKAIDLTLEILGDGADEVERLLAPWAPRFSIGPNSSEAPHG